MTAPAITLSDHRAVYDAKCGRPQSEKGVGQMRTPADRREGSMKRGHFLRTSFMDDHLQFCVFFDSSGRELYALVDKTEETVGQKFI